MVCIFCGQKTKTNNSRRQASGQVWRRHGCSSCKAVFTTFEEVDYAGSLRVIKKSGILEPFYRDKLFVSVLSAVSHRSNQVSAASSLTDTILRHIIKHKPLTPLISFDTIAGMTIKTLKNFDAAASVRYQSYRTTLTSAREISKSLKD